MVKNNRDSGIEIIGEIPWGTHLCQFYNTKEDLLDILVPYFKSGLENNEFCIWVTSKPLVKEEAEKAMRKALPHFDHYREKGQIEIVTHTDWYLKDDTFDFRRVLDAWIDKLNQALTKGYDGMRITGNTAWLEKRDWRSFTDYEEEINRVIWEYRIIAICSYSIDRCSAPDVIDVVSNHGFSLIRKEGAWKIIEDSEHTRLKKSLYSITEQYRSFVQNFHGIAFYRHIDFTPIFMHGALEEITGYTAEMFTSGNLRWDKIIHPEDLTRLSELFEKLRSIPRYSDVYEYRIIRKDGKVRWIQEYCQNLCDDSGKPIIVRGARYDITERKQAEEALRNREAFNFALFEYNPVETIMVDRDGKITMFNLAKKNSGDRLPSTGEVMYKDYASKHEIDMFGEMMECIKKNGVKNFSEMKYRDRFLSITISPFPLGAIIISEDITERKKAEEALRESEEKFRLAFENANTGMCLVDLDGNFHRVNTRMCEIFGYSKEELEHVNVYTISHPEDVNISLEFINSALSEKYDYAKYEKRYVSKQGQNIWGQVSISLVRDSQGNPLYFVSQVEDITKSKRAEMQLREDKEKLRLLALELTAAEDRERRRIAEYLHDMISQALVVIKMKLGTLQELKDTEPSKVLNKEISELLEQTIESTRAVTFDLSSPVLDKLGFEPAAEWLCEKVTNDHGLAVDFSCDSRTITLDDDMKRFLYRSVRELLMNVVKHANAQSVKVSVRREKGMFCITVDDDGDGFRDTLEDNRYLARGFGLFSIRERLDYLGGHMEIDSKPGRGASVSLYVSSERKKRSKKQEQP